MELDLEARGWACP